jgi:protocatechuate 3,4-dioxygenase, alpha subunit
MTSRATPSQTVGPFFGIGFSWLETTDLTGGASAGTRVTICGRVIDGANQPVPDAVLEIWQADADGRYSHPEDARELPGANPRLGFGRVAVDQEGKFRFSTLKPGGSSDPNGTRQAPHLMISIFMRGLLRRLTTRMYFPSDPANESDAVLARVPASRRNTIIARPADTEEASLVWDVHLQGDQETVFFDC